MRTDRTENLIDNILKFYGTIQFPVHFLIYLTEPLNDNTHRSCSFKKKKKRLRFFTLVEFISS